MGRKILLGDVYSALFRDYPVQEALHRFYSANNTNSRKSIKSKWERIRRRDPKRELLFCWIWDEPALIAEQTEINISDPKSFVRNQSAALSNILLEEDELKKYLEANGYPSPNALFEPTIYENALQGSLPSKLSIKQISLLLSKGTDRNYSQILEELREAALMGEFYSDIEDTASLVAGNIEKIDADELLDPEDIDPELLMVHKNSVESWLINQGNWPLGEAIWLSKWWHVSKTDTSIQHPHKIAQTKRNSVFPFPPKNTSDWFIIIEEVANEFFEKNNELPSKQQVWRRLTKYPPTEYGVSVKRYKGKRALLMEGVIPLSKASFYRRWGRYTKPNDDKT